MKNFSLMIDRNYCNLCCNCINICPNEVIGILGGETHMINEDDCKICESCMDVCENKAINVVY